jgi:glycosyltransferase involved in cell wall biosynthesis
MRIGIDLTHTYQRQGGIPRYGLELARALLSIDQGNEYVWFFRGETRPELAGLGARMHVSPIRHQVFCEQTWLYLAARQARLDILHLTGFAGPLMYKGAAVATLMDMTQFLHPETMKFKQALYWRWLFPLSLKRKQAIVTISDHSRQDASRLLGIPLEKITSIPLACSYEFWQEKSPSQLDETARRLNLPEKYFLLVGAMEPRKNHSRVLEAYARFRKKNRALPHLVFAGGHGWRYASTRRRLAELELTDHVHFIGTVSDGDLACLYRRAEALLYPSLYEGFGLPILEAMASGCPVITSNVSSMPEVAGEAALLVAPQDVGEIASAMEDILDPSIARRLREKGWSQARQFSWEKTAQQTLEIYRNLA